MKKMVSKTLMACAITAALGALSSGAMAQTAGANFPDFNVTESPTVGAGTTQTLTADKITGNYTEVITFSGNTFQASLLWNAGQFVANDGSTPVASQLSPTGGTAAQYGLYALYQANGTFSTSGGVTNFTFAPGTPTSLRVFIDKDSNTTFTAPGSGSGAWATANTSDDLLVATGAAISGQGSLNPTLPTCSGGPGSAAGINCGSFGSTTSFNLTTAGSSYFTAPNPFYNVSFQSGQLDNFSPTGTQTINGSLDVVFNSQVPEPGSIALIGLGILGLGMSRRRKQA